MTKLPLVPLVIFIGRLAAVLPRIDQDQMLIMPKCPKTATSVAHRKIWVSQYRSPRALAQIPPKTYFRVLISLV